MKRKHDKYSFLDRITVDGISRKRGQYYGVWYKTNY